MFKIVVIADTHMPRMAKTIPKKLLSDLEAANLVIHVGDVQTVEVLKAFEKFAPLVGVYGNVDDSDIQSRFPNSLLLELDNLTIGITHGHGKSRTTEKRAIEKFQFEDVDIIIFGHSHIPILKQYEDILLFNPGSPTDKRREKQFSYGIIEISEYVNIKHIFYDDKS
ncbi:metallophosphoesterase family protein [Aquibacillus kalidii]|uniref:metallophosphoesterase family protein n=1 Tax=Aquibacillus kalidii TaxID=2762597 RepID=UPI001644AE68|nr:metallophosphoesterase [Aquibacillus kalidii]